MDEVASCGSEMEAGAKQGRQEAGLGAASCAFQTRPQTDAKCQGLCALLSKGLMFS